MYKNVLIIGPGRAGKTTLSKMLNKEYGYSIISIDDIVSGFEAYPKLKIHHDGDAIDTAKRLEPFLIKYLSELTEGRLFNSGIKFVIEGTHIDFEKIIPYLESDKYRKKYMIMGLTYNNVTEQQLYDCLRKNDTEDDWTYWCSNEELKGNVKYLIKRNRYFDEKFNEYNIKTFDTSKEREKVLKQALKYVEENAYGKKDTN